MGASVRTAAADVVLHSQTPVSLLQAPETVLLHLMMTCAFLTYDAKKDNTKLLMTKRRVYPSVAFAAA